ncbi:hypothetical protein J3A83DRAFT_4184496 [Scleroderma citrinum]
MLFQGWSKQWVGAQKVHKINSTWLLCICFAQGWVKCAAIWALIFSVEWVFQGMRDDTLVGMLTTESGYKRLNTADIIVGVGNIMPVMLLLQWFRHDTRSASGS